MHGHFAKTHIETKPSDSQKFEQLFPKENEVNYTHYNESMSNIRPGRPGENDKDKWDNKAITTNLSAELTKFNHKLDSGVNYPNLVTPQINLTKTNSDEFNSRQIINLEDLSYQEEKLVKLIDSLLLNQNITQACEDWLEIINITSIQNIEVS